MELQKRFEEFVRAKNLFSKGDLILLAVSGGVDSVVMAELFHRSKFKFGIAHCNFQLRAEESEADEQFVKNLAEKYGVPIFSTGFNTAEVAKENRLTIQETARNLRYEWFAELLEKNNFQCIATAHHLNDSIETFFINLLRGTGVAGLRGIKPIHEDRKTIRPMLFARKAELESYAIEEKISFRLDHSNETDLYFRNRIRHHLMPVLLQLNPQFEMIMERTMTNLAFAEGIVDEKIFSDFLIGYNENDENASLIIQQKDLLKSKFPLELFMAIVQPYGFNFSQVEDVWNAQTSGKHVFSDGYIITSDREKFILTRRKLSDALPQSIAEEAEHFSVPGLSLGLRSDKSAGALTLKLEDKNLFTLDKGKLTFPLTLRKWVEGDYFFPLGMKGRKKLSDFLTDLKVSRPDKEKTYVLLSGADIICVLGHRIDERYKVTGDTKEIYTIGLLSNE